jgi:hypothetical protein
MKRQYKHALHISVLLMLINAVSLSAQCVSKSNAPWELWIAKVQLNTLNNASEKYKDYSTLGYSDFTPVNTTLTKGMTYQLTTEAGISWSGILPNAYWRAWIDWNGNGVFEDAELVFQNTNVNPFVSSVRVPTTAAIGTTRMRIALKSNSYATPCEVFGSGEVEDYTVTIQEPQTPIGNTILQITSASVAPTIAKPGDTVAVTFTMKNNDSVPNSPNKTLKLSTGTSRSGKRSVGYDFYGFSNDIPIGVILQPNETRTLTRNFIINSDYSPIQPYPTPFEAYARGMGTFVGLSTANSLSSVGSLLDTFPYPLPSINIILPYADLEVTMSTTTPVYTGKEINYVVKIKNKSTDTIPDVEARVFDLGFISFDTATLTPSKGTTVMYNSVGEIYTVVGYWRAGSLAPNEEATCAVQIASGYFGLPYSSSTMRADVHSLRRFDTISANNNASLYFRRDTAPSGNSNDIALSISSTPSVYRQYTSQSFMISAKNLGNQVFTNVKIDFPFPTKTVNGGAATVSIGTWQEWCAGGTQCFTWTIPSLAANENATLDLPVYILDALNPMTATTHLLSSNPVDNIASNNVATVIINRANSPSIPPLINAQLTPLNPILNQQLNPTITDNYIVVELESLMEKQIKLDIINSLGIVVLNKEIELEKGNNSFNFNVAHLPKGMYFIRTNVGDGMMKFIKF